MITSKAEARRLSRRKFIDAQTLMVLPAFLFFVFTSYGPRPRLPPEIEEQLAEDDLKLNLNKIGKAALEVTAESGPALADQLHGGDGYVDDGTARPAVTIMKIRTAPIVIRYREFKDR